MSDGAGYSTFHPRWLRRRVSTWWWLERRSYLAFILRELSSVAVAWFVIFFLLLLRAVGQGEAAWQQFLVWAAEPVPLLINGVSLLFVTYHAITWFNLAPSAVAVRVRGRRLPGFWIAAPNYIAWAAATALIAWLLIGARA